MRNKLLLSLFFTTVFLHGILHQNKLFDVGYLDDIFSDNAKFARIYNLNQYHYNLFISSLEESEKTYAIAHTSISYFGYLGEWVINVVYFLYFTISILAIPIIIKQIEKPQT